MKLLSCVQLCDPMDCSLPGSSTHGIFQARVLEWVAISFSRGSSRPSDKTQVPRLAGRRFTVWATREAMMKTLRLKEVKKLARIHEAETTPMDAKDHTLLHQHSSWWGNYKSHRRIWLARLGNNHFLGPITLGEIEPGLSHYPPLLGQGSDWLCW